MKNFSTLIGAALILFASFANPGAAGAVEVKINPTSYTGQWTVDYGPVRRGMAVVDLGEPDSTTGFHVISLGGAEMFFSVAADGTVTVENAAAAQGGSHQLKFNTTKIAIHPRHFLGSWQVTDGATPKLVGPQVVTLVRGLSYYSLKVGANGAFFFHITEDGHVQASNSRAKGGFRSLVLQNTKWVDVTPEDVGVVDDVAN